MLFRNKQKSKNSTAIVAQPVSQEKKREQENFQDVLILLRNLIEREEKTISMIIDSLYEIGSASLIDKKINSKALNGLLKSIRMFPKPVFKIIALRWVKQKSPLIITNWLFRKVKF
jgi:hypothetical protein